MKNETFYPLISQFEKPANTHDPLPFGQEWHKDVAVILAAGKVTVELDSAFGFNIGEVYGIIPLRTKGNGDNEGLFYQVSASTNHGKVIVSVHSSNNAATDSLSLTFWLYGKAFPLTA